MKDKVIYIQNCRLCNSKDISVVSKLEPTPIGDKFLRNKESALSLEMHNNEIVLCKECGQIQLSEIIEPAQVYDEDYLYTTDVSIGLPEHFMKSCEEITRRFELKRDNLVVEFGSNKGIMLKAFQEKGMRVLGIEPATEVAKQAIEIGVETKIEFFTRPLAQSIAKEFGRANIIIANNVIANIPNLEEIALSLVDLLDEKGIFIFETSYAIDVFESHLIDTIYHEHISYLAVKPLVAFFDKFGLKLFDAEQIGTKGGSLRGFVSLKTNDIETSDNVFNLINLENNSGIYDLILYKTFDLNLQDFKTNILNKIKTIKSFEEDIVCYGASVGCTTMLYHFDMVKDVDYLIDDNPVKFGKYLPGSTIEVFDSNIIYEKQKLKTLFVLAWRYIDSICDKHTKFIEQGGKFLVLDLSKLTLVEYSNEK